jgi:hypothetical protein
MKLWIARDFNERLYLYEKKPKLNPCNNEFYCIYGEKFYQLDIELFPEITFENSPKEVELKIPVTKLLTRDYFANHNWEIVIHEPDESGFILWEAKWKRSMEEGSPYYSDLTVTNMMYEDRFCISGKTGEGNVEYLMAYTEEDLENILKVLNIYDYYKKES